jgi:hypothetical protein
MMVVKSNSDSDSDERLTEIDGFMYLPAHLICGGRYSRRCGTVIVVTTIRVHTRVVVIRSAYTFSSNAID